MNESFKKKILLIDDEEDFLALLQDHLEHAGYEVVVAHDGQEGLDALAAENPDLIILDVMMPHLNGHQFWSFLQKDPMHAKTPLFVLSAKMQATDTFWKSQMSPADYLIKTVGMDKILQRVREKLKVSV